MNEQEAEDLAIEVNLHDDWYAYIVQIAGSRHPEDIGTWKVIAQPSEGDYVYLTSLAEWIVLREKWDARPRHRGVRLIDAQTGADVDLAQLVDRMAREFCGAEAKRRARRVMLKIFDAERRLVQGEINPARIVLQSRCDYAATVRAFQELGERASWLRSSRHSGHAHAVAS